MLTVRLLHDTAEAVTFNYALEAFTLRGTNHTYFVAFNEYIRYRNLFAEVFGYVHIAEFEHFVEWLFKASGFEMAHKGLRSVFGFTIAVSQLEGFVAVLVFGTHLSYGARASLNDRHCNVFTVGVVDAGHT
jgi:hypothetical protein